MNGHCDRCNSLTQTTDEFVKGLCEACIKDDLDNKIKRLEELFDKVPQELRQLVNDIVELELEIEEECEWTLKKTYGRLCQNEIPKEF